MKIIKFEATWCNTCRAMDRELSKLKDIPIEHIDIDEDASEKLAGKYNIRNLPTTLIIDEEGKELHRFAGVVKAEDIQYVWNHINE